MTNTQSKSSHNAKCSKCGAQMTCELDYCSKRPDLFHVCEACQAKRDAERREQQKKDDEERKRVLKEATDNARDFYKKNPLPSPNHYWFRDRGEIPERFKHKSFNDFTMVGNESAVRDANEAVLENRSVFISGECGRGKTHLAVALAREWFCKNIAGEIDHGGKFEVFEHCKPCFLPAVEFFFELKQSFNDKVSTSESDIIKHYAEISLLIIDDIGAEKVSDWSRQIFYTLLDRRYRDMKQTIITSNLNLSDLAQQIDVRISSRILEMGVAIQLKGTDMRAKK